MRKVEEQRLLPHLRVFWPDFHPLQQGRQLFVVPFRYDLNASIWQVSDPANKIQGFRFLFRVFAIKDPLHFSFSKSVQSLSHVNGLTCHYDEVTSFYSSSLLSLKKRSVREQLDFQRCLPLLFQSVVQLGVAKGATKIRGIAVWLFV